MIAVVYYEVVQLVENVPDPRLLTETSGRANPFIREKHEVVEVLDEQTFIGQKRRSSVG